MTDTLFKEVHYSLGGLITETIARRERLKDYDLSKKYGAERVLERDRAHVGRHVARADEAAAVVQHERRSLHHDVVHGLREQVRDVAEQELGDALDARVQEREALAETLAEGRIFADGCDVYEKEPAVHPALRRGRLHRSRRHA